MAEVNMSGEEIQQRTATLIDQMSRHVALAAFVVPGAPSPHTVVDNGTISLLELPTGKYLVTNCHVWDAFVERRLADSHYRLGLTGAGLAQVVDISSAELVDADAGIDLAVLKFRDPEIIESVGKAFYKPKRFPLDAPIEGDDVAMVGYPGNRREDTDEFLYHEAVLLTLKVAAVSDRKTLLNFTNPSPEVHWFSPNPVDEFRWGGMSGSMVYRIDPDLKQFFVTGFLHAAGNGLGANFYISRADVIREDGHIRR